MPSVDVLINIHTTYFSCLDMLVTSGGSWLTLELPISGKTNMVPGFTAAQLHIYTWAAQGDAGAVVSPHPCHFVMMKRDGMTLLWCEPDTSKSRISRQWGFVPRVFLPLGQTMRGSEWWILHRLKSPNEDRMSCWNACLNQKHKLLGPMQGTG